MIYDFTADDVFEMAEQIEKNGNIFYLTAAESLNEKEAKELLLEFAYMEKEHEKIFSDMRKSLSSEEKQKTVFDPESEAAQYLKALADTRVFFDKKIDVSSLENILKDAIQAEKDSIVFYLGMKEAVPEELGQKQLDGIIKEEMSHIRLLSNKLVQIKSV
ncbi:MAG: ferritin family protein [Desulfobacterales bacterium]